MAVRPASKLLLIAWDAAEWSLIQPLLDAGEMPNLARLLEQGTLAKLASISPPISAALWTTVATGLPPEQHGVLGDVEPAPDGRGAQPASAGSCRAPTLWQLADAAGLRSIVIGWPATHPATPLVHGIVVTDAWSRAVAPEPWPLPIGAVHPERLRNDLAELRVHPGEISRADVRPFVPDIDEVDEKAEPIVLALVQSLAASTSVHCAATYLLENEPWDLAAVHFAAPGAISRDFLDFAPPRLTHVPEKIFARYHRVIDETFTFHDRMLGRLLELAGPEAAVLLVSTSGWFTGARRPVVAPEEHAENISRQRVAGWAVLRTAGVKADDLLYGARALDLAPTIAWLLGLTVPPTWPGREWTHAFVTAPAVTREPGVSQRPTASEWIVAESPAAADDAGRDTALELRYNLARFLVDAGHGAEAVPILLQLHRSWPHRAGPALHLIPALAALGRIAEARGLLNELESRPEGGLLPRAGRRAKYPPRFDLMHGLLALAENQPAAALAHFERALVGGAYSPGLHIELGRVYFALRRTADARAAFERALEIDADSAEAHHGLALANYRLRNFPAAADHALQAAARRTEPAETHLLLGLALAHVGERTQAIEALHHALARDSRLLLAHRALVALHRGQRSEAFQAEAHRLAGRSIFLRRHREAETGRRDPPAR